MVLNNLAGTNRGRHLCRVKPSYTFLAYNEIYQSYSLLTEEDVKFCVGHKIVVCQVRRAIYATDALTCESSLFFQKPEARRLCPRQVTWNPSTPVWKRYETHANLTASHVSIYGAAGTDQQRCGTPGKRYGTQRFGMLAGESTVPHSGAAHRIHRGRRQRRGVHPRTTGSGGRARDERPEGNSTGADQTVGPPAFAATHPTLYG